MYVPTNINLTYYICTTIYIYIHYLMYTYTLIHIHTYIYTYIHIAYKELLPVMDDYLTSPGGVVNLRQADLILAKVGRCWCIYV